MQNARRRWLLEYLVSNGGEAELNEVISHILMLEGKDESSRTRKSVYVSLLQTHLPKLEREQIVKYERSESKIVLINLPDDVKMYFETVGKWDIPWSKYYFFLSIVALFFSIYSFSIIGTAVSATFLTSSLVHIFTSKIKI